MPEETKAEPTQEEIDLTEKRDLRCEPIAEEIVQILAKHKPSPRVKDQNTLYEIYKPIVEEINHLMKEKDLTISDVNYTWRIVQGIIDSAKNLSNMTVENAFERMEAKLLGVDNVNDITLRTIDNMLQSK